MAADEARHFLLIETRLQQLDSFYGDFPAHDGLWEAATNTAHDLASRLAIVPLVLEARGLDVTPDMISKFERIGDTESAATVIAGNRLRVTLRESTGSGPRANVYVDGPRQAETEGDYSQRSNRLEIAGSLAEFTRSNRAIDPPPSAQFFAAGANNF